MKVILGFKRQSINSGKLLDLSGIFLIWLILPSYCFSKHGWMLLDQSYQQMKFLSHVVEQKLSGNNAEYLKYK